MSLSLSFIPLSGPGGHFMFGHLYKAIPGRGVTFPTLRLLAFKTYYIILRSRKIILWDVRNYLEMVLTEGEMAASGSLFLEGLLVER